MKLIEPEVKVIDTNKLDIYEQAAYTAYICYQTHPDKARLSPKEFVEQVLIKNGHLRPLEFATIYLSIPYWQTFETTELVSFFRTNMWSKVKFVGEASNPRWAVTTNMRVMYENNLMDYIVMYSCEPTEHHEKRYTADFICSRGASDDFRTHVMLSSVAESTRFCNYAKDKFENELTFINPYWQDSYKDFESAKAEYYFTIEEFKRAEAAYIKAAKMGMQSQQLKRIFPLGAKTQLRLCGFKDAWSNFFLKRCDSHADPECQKLANKLKDIIYVNN